MRVGAWPCRGVVCLLILSFSSTSSARTESEPPEPQQEQEHTGEQEQKDEQEQPEAPAQPAPASDGQRDEQLLAALLALEDALGARTGVADAIHRVGALDDARAVPRLLGLSRLTSPAVRLPALAVLSRFVDRPDVRARLRQALDDGGETDAQALWRRVPVEPAQQELPPTRAACEGERRCVDDKTLLHAVLRVYGAPPGAHADRARELGALSDPRALSLLWRVSYSRHGELRRACLEGLARQPEDPRARARMLEVLAKGSDDDVIAVIPGLSAAAGDDVMKALVKARDERRGPVSEAIERVVAHRQGQAAGSPSVAAETVTTETATTETVATEAATTEATEEIDSDAAATTTERTGAAVGAMGGSDATEPVENGRSILTGAAGLAGAYGGYASASVIARAVGAKGPGFLGLDQELWYGAYGLAVGAASAGALAWFSVGDAKLTRSDLVLSISAGVWGAAAFALVPLAIDNGAQKELRHSAYAAAVGQLAGLGLGTAGALFVENDASDQFELHLTLLATDGIAAGALLALPDGGDPRVLFGSVAGATLVGAALYPFVRPVLDLDGHDAAHLLTASSVGLALGLQAGVSASALERHPTRGFGLTVLGTSLGLGTALTLSAFGARPSLAGDVYEAYATTAGSLTGIGAGMFLERVPGLDGNVPRGALPFALGAGVGLAGALTTFAAPDGIELDAGDLLLQPLLMGYSLFHTSAAFGLAEADPELILASALIAPSVVSFAAAHAAPWVNPRLSDLVLIGAMMGWGATLSAFGTGSVAGRIYVPPWVWILTTSAGMDLGIVAGVGLSLLDVDKIGWRVAYVTSAAGASSLVLALPGSLLAKGSGGVVQVPDVLLASAVIGGAVGLLTLPLIDFDGLPDIPIDDMVPLRKVGLDVNVSMAPSIDLLPTAEVGEQAMTWGVRGTF